MVALFVMGCALLLFCAAVVAGQRSDSTSQVVTAMGADVEPASLALLAVIGALMVVLGSYPATTPRRLPAPTAVSSTSGPVGTGGPTFSVRVDFGREPVTTGLSRSPVGTPGR